MATASSLKVGDFLEVFETDDGVIGGGEAVLAGVLSGTDPAFGGAPAGRSCGIGAIGCELLGGNCVLRVWHVVHLSIFRVAWGKGGV
jgi:hypothetical protein